MAKEPNILRQISDKSMLILEWLNEEYGIFGIAAFLIVGAMILLSMFTGWIALLQLITGR